MAFVPNTIVKLLSVNFENDYKNVVYWSSLSAQQSEMESCVRHTFTEFTYQRKDNVIRIPAHIDTLYDCNYVMYKNKNHSNKWFYAFITDMEYINDNCTHIKIETDVWGTWWNDINVKPSFVEREHCSNDAVGGNTFPEGLETGEYIANGVPKYDIVGNSGICAIVAVSEDLSGKAKAGLSYSGVFSGLAYRFCLAGDDHSLAHDVSDTITAYSESDNTTTEAIHSIFLAPTALVTIGKEGYVANTDTASSWDLNLGSAPTSVDGYSPRNKKLLTYPYSYLYVTNQQGVSNIIHNEKFYTGVRKFRTYGTLCHGCSVRTLPLNYNNIEENSDEGINLGKFPVCSWVGDVYTNWLTQNSVNTTFQTIGSLATAGAGIGMSAMGNLPMGLGMIGTGIAGVMNVIGQKAYHRTAPEVASGNTNCGDVVYSSGQNKFKWIDMSIKAEYARIIDDFFDRYGYKVNRVKEPNKDHRPIWWYTKTIGVNIDAPIPQNDLARIRKMYDDGVTFWRNHTEVEHYEKAKDNVI